jgi:hypothetical protein
MMIAQTLYKKYIEEREGLKLLEDPFAFITYKVTGEECFIANMFIDESRRNSGKCREFIGKLSEIAKSNNCKFLSATIDLKDPGHDRTLLAALHLGFKTVRANGDVILIAKDLGG